MRRRTSTTIVATTALALMISVVSADRAEARHWGGGWGWGIGGGIATALILGSIYRHHRYYGYYRPRHAYYGYRYYRPRYALAGYGYWHPRWRYRHWHGYRHWRW
jgi:hypothetical protein